ncbi:MAG TPA: ABC transporter permease [Bacteroidales bacterium]|nr:ABC transporter permease [Bacteroidales bacterium]
MNTPLFIARKISPSKQGKTFTGLIRKISVLSIALGLAVMIVAVAVVTGFQIAIRDKVIGFGSHIQVTNFQASATPELTPIVRDPELLESVAGLPGIRHVQEFASKTGIIKTEEDIHGVVMKGIGPDFDWSFFEQRMVEGGRLVFSDTAATNEVIISRYIAEQLFLETGDRFFLYFIQDPPALRRLQVAGIYETGLEELDRIFVLGDIKHIQRINRWEPDQIGGYEILVNDFDKLDEVAGQVFNHIPYHLNARSIREIYPQIFDWLALLDMNVYVILFLMVLVAGINMVTTLLVAVLEKTNMIGILKAVGASNRLVKNVFLYNAAFVILKGLFWGNVLGLSFCLIQNYLGIVTLPQDSYYVSVVPINLELVYVLGLNAGTFAVCMFMLIGPSMIVARISPVRAIIFR